MKKSIAFICTHNSCRSQMAEGYMKKLGNSIFFTYSAGTEKYPEVKPKAIKVMQLDNIDISNQYPKLLKDVPSKLDVLITMGCGVKCPNIPCGFREDWELEDPSGGSIEQFIQTRDLIKQRVINILNRVKEDKL